MALAFLALCVGCGVCASIGSASASTTAAAAKAPKTLFTATKGTFTKADCNKDKAAGAVTVMEPYGYGATPTNADIWMAQNEGYFSDLCLNVDINTTPGASSLGLVSADTAQVGTTDAATVTMGYIANGAPIVGVSTDYVGDPTSIITAEKIKSLKQLEGGTLGYPTSIPYASIAILGAAGVKITDVKFVKLGSSQPTAIEAGTVDAMAADEGTQDLELKDAGVKYHEFTPSQFGLNGAGAGLYMNKKFVAEHPYAAANFIRADLMGMEFAYTHASRMEHDMATIAAKRGDGAIDTVAYEVSNWEFNAKLLANPNTPYGEPTVAEWKTQYNEIKKYQPTVNALEGLPGASSTVPALSSMLDSKLVASLYDKQDQLVWP